jgi:acetone carboxylase gamma subunit
MAKRRMSVTLDIVGEGRAAKIACHCGHALGPAGKPWKPAAALHETRMKKAAGTAYDSADKVLLRRFYCPGCGALLDSETALPGAPFLNDVIEA